MSRRAKGSHYREVGMMMAADEDVIGSTLGNSWGEESFISQSYLKVVVSLWASFPHSVAWGSS